MKSIKFLTHFRLNSLVGAVMVFLIIFTSCTNLTQHDYSEVTAANFKPTKNDIPSLIAPVYTVLRPMWMGWQGNIDVQEESADEIVTPARPNGWYDGGTYQRMHFHKWNAFQWQPHNLWNNCFSGINAANRVIYQINSGTIPITSGKTALLAELKAARAYFYYELLDNFGNVPIVTDFKSQGLPEQSTRKQVYDFVVKQLQDAIPNLSTDADQSMYGRVNKWVAETILAKVYLNADVYIGTPEWNKVIQVTDDIINSGKYKLAANYRDNFTKNNQDSPEIIWAVPYDEINGQGNGWHMKTLPPAAQKVYNMQAQPWGGNCAVPQFINTYDSSDTRLKETWLQGPYYDSQGKLIYTLKENVPSIIKGAGFYDGYRIGKYEIYNGETSNSDVDYPIFRYADVLMMKAEALLRTGHADQAATIVTQVRQRDFKTDPSKATVTGADLMKGSSYDYGYWDQDHVVNAEGGANIKYGRFLDELGWEFAAEGHRRQDMIRFGVFTTKTWFNHKPVGKYTRLFPIPQAVLNNNPNLKQNPGY